MSIGFSLIDLVKSVFQPAAKLIDELHTSDEERINAQRKMLEAQATIMEAAIGLQVKALEAREKVILAETSSDSWLARNWRPITMLTFVSLVVTYWLGIAGTQLEAEQLKWMMTSIDIGIGGYIIGRSGEKIVKTLKEGNAKQ